MLKFFYNWAWWKEASLARSMEMNTGTRRAFDAEIAVQDRIDAMLGTLDSKRGLRIPNVLKRIGSGEVDVVVLTDRSLILLEVKFWKGNLSIDENRNIRQEGKTSKPVLQTLEAKVENMKRLHLQRFKKDVEIEHLVVFAHSNSTLSPSLQGFRNVTTLDNLEGSVTKLLENRQVLSQKETFDYQKFLQGFGQYDSLCTPGGECLFGDISDESSSPLLSRERCLSIDISLARGRFATFFLGPRLSVTLNLRDGSKEHRLIKPEDNVFFSQPWKVASSTERTIPIQFFSSIEFGTMETIFKDEYGNVTSVGPVVRESTPKPVKMTIKQRTQDALSRFDEGEIYTGTVVKHLRTPKGGIDGILVSLESRLITGLLGRDEVCKIDLGLIGLYGVGRSIDVRVRKIHGPKKIFLELN
jgi:hypothetical protein